MTRFPPDPASYTMSFGDHLDELRRRIFLALAAPLPLFIIVFLFSDTLIEWLLLPVFEVLRQHGLPTDLQVLSPPEFLLTKLKLSLITAVILTAPWMLWQLWLFTAPGLYRHERRFVRFLLPGSFILIIVGEALLYFVMLPLMLHVLVMFATDIRIDSELPPDRQQTYQRLLAAENPRILTAHPESPAPGDVWFKLPEQKTYIALRNDAGAVEPVLVTPQTAGAISQAFRVSFVINFTLILMLGIAIAFQMPLVILLLGWLGLVSADWLRARRKYALLVCALLAAMTTPADAVSMIIMLIPLYALYELGILLLVVAPASVVADGAIIPWRFARRVRNHPPSDKTPTDKPPAQARQPDDPAQPDAPAPAPPGPSQSPPPKADGGDER